MTFHITADRDGVRKLHAYTQLKVAADPVQFPPTNRAFSSHSKLPNTQILTTDATCRPNYE